MITNQRQTELLSFIVMEWWLKKTSDQVGLCFGDNKNEEKEIVSIRPANRPDHVKVSTMVDNLFINSYLLHQIVVVGLPIRGLEHSRTKPSIDIQETSESEFLSDPVLSFLCDTQYLRPGSPIE